MKYFHITTHKIIEICKGNPKTHFEHQNITKAVSPFLASVEKKYLVSKLKREVC